MNGSTEGVASPNTMILGLIRAGQQPSALARISPDAKANIVLKTDAVARYAKILMALFRPRSRKRSEIAKERAEMFATIKADLERRIVTDLEGKPVMFKGEFEWKPGERHAERGMVRTHIVVMGESIEAVPPINVGMEWLKLDIEERWVSNGSFYFFVFRPAEVKDTDMDQGHHVAFPIGLCRSKVLKSAAGLYAEDDPKRIEIKHIESDLDRTGTRKFTYTATYVEVSRRSKELPEDKWQYVLGHYMGKIVMTEVGSGTPVTFTKTVERMNRETRQMEEIEVTDYCETGVYRYLEGGNTIIVKWLGSAGTVDDKDEVRFLDVAYECDPFEALGRTVLDFENGQAVAAYVGSELAEKPMNEDHPLLSMVVEGLGLCGWDSEIGEQVDFMLEVENYVVPKATEIVWQLREAIEALFNFNDFEEIGTALKDVDLVPLKEAAEGEDILTTALSAKIGVPFDWSKAMYRSLRLWLLSKAVVAVVREERPAATEEEPAGTEAAETGTEEPVAEQPEAAAPAPDIELTAIRYNGKIADVRVGVDAIVLLGLTSTKASDAIAELRVIAQPDLVAVALVVNEVLKAKGKSELDPATEKDAAKLARFVEQVKAHVEAEITRKLTAG